MHVIGRRSGAGEEAALPTGHLGRYLARDGSLGATVGIDLDRPHAGLVVGKRGSGKSHTLGVLVEAAARAPGVAPVVVDPMGAFAGLAAPAEGAPVPAAVVDDPTIRADAIPPTDWPDLVGLEPDSAAGGLVWAAAAAGRTLAEMGTHVADADAPGAVRRVATNHLRRAAAWRVFDPDGLAGDDLFGGEATVLSLTGLDDAPSSAVVAAVARMLYDARVDDASGEGARAEVGRAADARAADAGKDGGHGRLPWLFVDEAHVALRGVAAGALRTLLTRGRAPGVSLLLATQRPSALPAVAVSQTDLVVAHRLTSERDVEALDAARPTFFEGALRDRLPQGVGEALIVDDATEATHTVRVRERDTPHGGTTPRASDRSRPASGMESDRCPRPNHDS